MISAQLDSDLINAALRRIPDLQFEYRHGCLLGRMKLPVSAVNVVVIPSCNGTHLVLSLPFKEVKAEGAGSFFLSKIISTFWSTIAKQIETGVLPKLIRLGFRSDILTVERASTAGGDVGQIRISLASLNLWLEARHPRLRPNLVNALFNPEGVEVHAQLNPPQHVAR